MALPTGRATLKIYQCLLDNRFHRFHFLAQFGAYDFNFAVTDFVVDFNQFFISQKHELFSYNCGK